MTVKLVASTNEYSRSSRSRSQRNASSSSSLLTNSILRRRAREVASRTATDGPRPWRRFRKVHVSPRTWLVVTSSASAVRESRRASSWCASPSVAAAIQNDVSTKITRDGSVRKPRRPQSPNPPAGPGTSQQSGRRSCALELLQECARRRDREFAVQRKHVCVTRNERCALARSQRQQVVVAGIIRVNGRRSLGGRHDLPN